MYHTHIYNIIYFHNIPLLPLSLPPFPPQTQLTDKIKSVQQEKGEKTSWIPRRDREEGGGGGEEGRGRGGGEEGEEGGKSEKEKVRKMRGKVQVVGVIELYYQLLRRRFVVCCFWCCCFGCFFFKYFYSFLILFFPLLSPFL